MSGGHRSTGWGTMCIFLDGRARARLLVSAFAIVFVTAALTLTDLGPAGAAIASETNWALTNNQVGASNVTYSYSFKTASAGTVRTVTFLVSGSGLAGTPAIEQSYGIGAGSVTRTGQTITYTVASAVSVPSGTAIYIEFSGLTNSLVSGSYVTTITTEDPSGAAIDAGTTPSVVLSADDTEVTVAIGETMTFSIDQTSFELDLDPSVPALADQSDPVELTVLSDAHSGYSLVVSDLPGGLQSSAVGTPTIPRVSSGKADSVAWPGSPGFGYTVTGVGATIDPAFSNSKYAGYTSAGEEVASRPGSTGGTADTITITNRVAINYSIPAGLYSDSLTFTVTPNYT